MIGFFNNFSFRDRRYEYKGLNKVWKGKLAEAKASGNSMKIQEAQVWIILCILCLHVKGLLISHLIFPLSILISFAGYGCSL